ncbi:MAG: TlpA family protein disulfide reductase [Thermoanaerobaculia bacterium]|nr:TlpA family protein disulfide reductase [Thermoanaerobaculia bacterium]
MKKKLILLFLLAAFMSGHVYGQYTDGTAIITALNKRVREVPKGMFTLESRFKFADGEDTITHRGVCYFFRESNPDSIAHFVVLTDGKPVYAFDGVTFYQAIGADKMWVTETSGAGGLKRLLGGNIMKRNLIFENLLRVDRPNFRPSGFDTVEIRALQQNGQSLLRLTTRDTSIETALGNVENNKIISTYYWDIALPDFYLTQFAGEVWLFDGWQYNQHIVSAITPLPAEARLADYFDPEKWAAVFTFEQYDPNKPVKRETELIKEGDQLPDFTLTDLEGKTFALKEQKRGLLLLDFWYKGCFPCQLAMPKIERLHQKYADKGLKVLGVNPFDKNNDAIKEWLQTRKVTYNTLFDPEKQLPKAVGIEGYPLLVVADAKTKKVLFVETGYREELESILEPVINKHLK